MTEELRFLAYCVETYKGAKELSGREVFELFRRTGAWDYLWDSYDALHTTGPEYTTDQIDKFIEAHA
ncbi:MAG: DUF3791 domain-containing protein [Bifidobacteriaceae bacterium]|jgi:hypothetical protein|nr:DUF3791 domain-containing protein [Bifidobacteriaceae bacterium]